MTKNYLQSQKDILWSKEKTIIYNHRRTDNDQKNKQWSTITEGHTMIKRTNNYLQSQKDRQWSKEQTIIYNHRRTYNDQKNKQLSTITEGHTMIKRTNNDLQSQKDRQWSKEKNNDLQSQKDRQWSKEQTIIYNPRRTYNDQKNKQLSTITEGHKMIKRKEKNDKQWSTIHFTEY